MASWGGVWKDPWRAVCEGAFSELTETAPKLVGKDLSRNTARACFTVAHLPPQGARRMGRHTRQQGFRWDPGRGNPRVRQPRFLAVH
jgi:hypothetical protein